MCPALCSHSLIVPASQGLLDRLHETNAIIADIKQMLVVIRMGERGLMQAGGSVPKRGAAASNLPLGGPVFVLDLLFFCLFCFLLSCFDLYFGFFKCVFVIF